MNFLLTLPTTKRISILCVLFLCSFAKAQQCDPDRLASIQGNLQEGIRDLGAYFESELGLAQKDAAYGYLANANQREPGPSSKRLVAPAYLNDTTTIVNDATAPEIIGLALEGGLGSDVPSRATIAVNAFALPSLLNPQKLTSAETYAKSEQLRRLSWSFTGGGLGQAFDRDNDGQIDAALKSDSFSDMFTWEIQYRFFGTRDVVDQIHQKSMQRARSARANAALNEIRNTISWANGALSLDVSCSDDDVDRTIAATSSDLKQIVEQARSEFRSTAKKMVSDIRQTPVWTVAVGGTERSKDFGGDSYSVSLRGNIKDFALNGLWTKSNIIGAASDAENLSLGIEYSWLWLENTAISDHGLTVALSGKYEKFRNTPGALHDTIAKLNFKVELPLSESIKIPISLTWANRADLLADEKDVSGHIGFTFDTSALLKFGSGN